MKKNRLFDSIFLAPGLSAYIIFMIVPLLICFYYAFTNWNGFSPAYDYIGLDNFRTLFRDAHFINAMRVTFIIMIVTTLIYNILGIILAVVLNDKGRILSFTKSALFIPTVMSSVVVAFIWSYMIQSGDGVINTILSTFGFSTVNFYATPLTTIITISAIISWNSLGFFVVLYIATLSTIPQELYEASRVDGAGWLAKFRYITLPLLAPGITICSILAVSGGLRHFDHVRVITGGGPGGATQTVTLFAVNMAFERSRRGYSSAAILILFFLIVVLSIIQLRISKKYEVEY